MSDGKSKSRRDLPPEPAENGGGHSRIQAVVPIKRDIRIRQGGKKIGVEPLRLRHPPLIPGEGLPCARVSPDGKLPGITPAGRLPNNRPVDPGRQGLPPGNVGCWCECTTIEQMLLNPVPKQDPELRIGPELRINAGGCVRTVHIDPVPPHQPVQANLLVPRIKSPPGGRKTIRGPAMGRIPVVEGPVLSLCNPVHQHVVRKVCQIHQLAQCLVGGVARHPRVHHHHHLVPVVLVPVTDLRKIIGFIPCHHIPIPIPPTVMGNEEVRIQPFRWTVQAPVKPVDIEVDKGGPGGRLAHLHERILNPRVPQVEGAFRPVTEAHVGCPRDDARIRIARGPAVAEAHRT